MAKTTELPESIRNAIIKKKNSRENATNVAKILVSKSFRVKMLSGCGAMKEINETSPQRLVLWEKNNTQDI